MGPVSLSDRGIGPDGPDYRDIILLTEVWIMFITTSVRPILLFTIVGNSAMGLMGTRQALEIVLA